MSKDDGGPAFPADYDYEHGTYIGTTGMSLRDWFAGQALAGVRVDLPGSTINDLAGLDAAIGAAAKVAYLTADAMLAERNKQETE